MSGPRSPRLLLLTVGLGVGGAEEILLQSLPSLQEEGFDVTLASLKEGGRLRGEIEARDGRVETLGGSGRWNPVPLGRLWATIRRGEFDVIHSHLYWANLAARLVGRSAGGAAIVNSHHGTDAWIFASRRWLERATFFLADRAVVCSDAVRRYAVEKVGLPPERVVTVPNGILAERFLDDRRRHPIRSALGLAPEQLVVGTVGRLEEPVKGLAVLLEAMAVVGQKVPGTVCLVIGDGPERVRLEASAKRMGLSERFRFLGERRDVPDLLQAVDLYVQPSLFEGFGLSALEAMAAGKAVIASRVGGLPEVVEDGITGDLVSPGEPEILAESVARLLLDPMRRDRYGRAGREQARNRFPLRKMIRGWTAVYRELMACKGRREAA